MADLLLDACKRRALQGEPRVLLIEMGRHRVVPGMGEQIREFVEDALRRSHVGVHTLTRVVNVSSDGITFEHHGKQEELKASGVVWTGGVKMSPLVEQLDAGRTSADCSSSNQRFSSLSSITFSRSAISRHIRMQRPLLLEQHNSLSRKPHLRRGTSRLFCQAKNSRQNTLKSLVKPSAWVLNERLCWPVEKHLAVPWRDKLDLRCIHLVCRPGIIVLKSVQVGSSKAQPRVPFCPLDSKDSF
jgi:NADH dehydrogenase, FAD-containing subunit